jgi:hypothetical protein
MFSIPDDIKQVRLRLFEVKAPLEFANEAEFEKYFAHCTNFWSPNGAAYQRKIGKLKGCMRRHFRCVFWASKPSRPSKKTQGAPQRNKRTRDPISCPATASKTVHPDGRVVFQAANTCLKPHNHSIEELDRAHPSKFLKTVAQQEAHRGYAPSAILKTMNGLGGRHDALQKAMESVGIRWFTRQDVINQAARFRAQFPDSRRVGHDFAVKAQVDQVLQFLTEQNTAGKGPYYHK